MGGEAAAEYTRKLYDDVRGWYESADAKAQVVLAIDGAFLAFSTGAIFSKPGDLREVVSLFSVWTWSLLALTALCLLFSVISALFCLWSRIYSARELQAFLQEAEREKGDSTHYAPKTMWFFQMVASLDEARFRRTLEAIDASSEIEVLASQIYILSGNVRAKHRAVNVGFALSAATLILFFFAGLSYLVRSV